MGELFNAIIGKPEPTAEIDESLALSLVTSRSIQELLKFIVLPQNFGLQLNTKTFQKCRKKFKKKMSHIQPTKANDENEIAAKSKKKRRGIAAKKVRSLASIKNNFYKNMNPAIICGIDFNKVLKFSTFLQS